MSTNNPAPPSIARLMTAEALGTGLLVATVIGSGIMAERLAGGNTAIALLANTIATGAALIALITAFAPISGAHFNPAVTFVMAMLRAIPPRFVPAYLGAQIVGGLAGTVVANAMFDQPLLFLSHHLRNGAGQLLGELIATFGLVGVIIATARRRPDMMAISVAAFITAAYWFTSSTSFANPAVTIARAFSDTFAGIRPADTIGFIAAQMLGAGAAALLFHRLVPIIEPPSIRNNTDPEQH